MIERMTNADHINKIINDPSIHSWVCGPIAGHLDIAPVIADPRNVALFGEFGGVLFAAHQDGRYEAHTQVLPSGRGAWAMDMANAALLWMFSKTDATEVITRAPKGNLGARAMARGLHFEYVLTNKKGWVKDGSEIPADWFSLSIERWMKTAPGLSERGVWFHERLEAEYALIGKTEDVHEDDATHDQIVGGAVAMIIGGQMRKAEHYYNRWAVMAGYESIKVMSEVPALVDIREAVIAVKGDNFKVIKCR